MSSRRSRRSDLGEGCFASMRNSLRRVRRDAPTFVDMFLCVVIMAVLLAVDVVYLSNKHQKELQEISSLHHSEMVNMNTKFKEQIAKLNQRNHETSHKKRTDHEKGIEKLKENTHSHIDGIMERLQKELHELKEMQVKAIDTHHGEIHGDDEDHQHQSEENHDEPAG